MLAAAASVLLTCVVQGNTRPYYLEVNEPRKIVRWAGTDYPSDFTDDVLMWKVNSPSPNSYLYSVDRRRLSFVIVTLAKGPSMGNIQRGNCKVVKRAF